MGVPIDTGDPLTGPQKPSHTDEPPEQPAEQPSEAEGSQAAPAAEHPSTAQAEGTDAPGPPGRSRLDGPGSRARRAVLSLAVVVFGGGMAVLVLRAAIDRIRAGPAPPLKNTVIVPNLPPAWTPTPSPTLRPTRTPSPTPHTTPSPTPEINPVVVARQQMHDQNYLGAIESWSMAIQGAPEDDAAYYGRAVSSLQLTRGLRDREQVVEYSLSALDDADQAIGLSPELNGDYFLARSWAFENLGLAAYNRIDRDRLNEIALENLRTGIALPHSDPLADYGPVGLLLRLGRCEEALLEVGQLDQERGAGLAPSPTLSYYQGVGQLCTGRYRQALDALIEASNADAECEYDYQQAVALYMLDRTDEALRKLSTLITGCPTYDGYRYYLRGLIRYELGDLAGASEDLLEGALTAWDVRGLKAFVEARMLTDEGRPAEAVQQMQQAHLTFERTRGPFLARIQRELAALGGQPLAVTPLPSPAATPIPPLPPNHPTPPPVVRVQHNQGSGPLEVAPSETLWLHFRGPADFSYREALSLSIYLMQQELAAEPGLQMQLYDPSTQWWEDFPLLWGGNSIPSPSRFLYESGDLFIRIRNPGENVVTVEDLGLDLSVLDDSGQQVTWGFLQR